MKVRARDLGVPFEGTPGQWNAITDVEGVAVGHTTLIVGEGEPSSSKGVVRTGVTAILPRGKHFDPVFAAYHALNGNGEMTGAAWVEESGFLESPILITNTHSVGQVHDAAVSWVQENCYYDTAISPIFWTLPVVAETFDGRLNDINGFHVHREHVFSALDQASSGPVPEGSVGGGTGMICYQFKGGIGTASRTIELRGEQLNLGVLVQANYGLRSQLIVAGVPVGQELTDLTPEYHWPDPNPGGGSIIGVLATDAPLLPHQLERLAKRIPMGISRVGGIGANNSGDIFLAFSTANPGAASRSGIACLEMLPNDEITMLFNAAIQATEEAIVNALVAGDTMVGIYGNKVYGLPHHRLQEVLRAYNRLNYDPTKP